MDYRAIITRTLRQHGVNADEHTYRPYVNAVVEALQAAQRDEDRGPNLRQVAQTDDVLERISSTLLRIETLVENH